MKTFKQFFESLEEDGVAVTTTANVAMPPTIMTATPLMKKSKSTKGKRVSTLLELKRLYNSGFRMSNLPYGTIQQYIMAFNRNGYLYLNDQDGESNENDDPSNGMDGGSDGGGGGE